MAQSQWFSPKGLRKFGKIYAAGGVFFDFIISWALITGGPKPEHGAPAYSDATLHAAWNIVPLMGQPIDKVRLAFGPPTNGPSVSGQDVYAPAGSDLGDTNIQEWTRHPYTLSIEYHAKTRQIIDYDIIYQPGDCIGACGCTNDLSQLETAAGVSEGQFGYTIKPHEDRPGCYGEVEIIPAGSSGCGPGTGTPC